MKLKKRRLETALKVLLFVALASCLLPVALKMGFVESFDTTNVTTIVNITNARPDILMIAVQMNTTVNLNQGLTYRVLCNITIRDWNGFNDIMGVNASLYFTRNRTLSSPTDPNYYYRNESCTINKSVTSTMGYYLCTFDVYYFAFNGTWNCSANAWDYTNFTINGSNTTNISALYAMNLTDLIDYGNLSVYDYSLNQTVNITNFGNDRINLSVFGYGGSDEARGAGWSLVCQNGSNITIGMERYSIYNGSSWAMMKPLTNAPAVTLENFMVVKQTVVGEYSRNETMWTLFVPPNPFGQCNGTVVFEALASRLQE